MQHHADLMAANLSAHLQAKTRIEFGDLQIEKAETHPVDLKVRVELSLQSAHSTKQFPGRTHPGSGDISAHSFGEAGRAVERECRAALSRPGLLQDAIDRFGSRPFSAQRGNHEMETHPPQVFHTYACTSCGGRGRLRCGNCGGAGKVTHGPCGGSGRITERVREQTTYNGHTSYTERDVTRSCNCQNGKVTCPNCHGSGELNCGPCGASGQLTNVTAISVRCELQPRYTMVQCAIPALEKELHEQLTPIEAGSISTQTECNWRGQDSLNAEGRYRFSTEASVLEVVIEDVTVRPLSFGNTAEILNYDGAVEQVISNDLGALQLELGQEPIVESKGAARKTLRRAVKDLMRSEIHQEMLDLVNKGQGSSAVSSSLKGGLSPAYVNQARAALVAATYRQKRFAEFFPWAAVTIGAAAAWPAVSQWFVGHSDSLGRFALPLAGLTCLAGWWVLGIALGGATSFARFAALGRKRLAVFAFNQHDIAIAPPSGIWRWLLYAASVPLGLVLARPELIGLIG